MHYIIHELLKIVHPEKFLRIVPGVDITSTVLLTKPIGTEVPVRFPV